MKIKKVRKSQGRIEVTFTDKGKNLIQVFQTEQEFKSWLKANRVIETIEVVAVILGFLVVIFGYLWIVSTLK